MSAALDTLDVNTTLARATKSFPAFCSLLTITPQEGGEQIPLRLTWIQKAYCEARTTRDIILKARKVYMTTLELARDLWWFLSVKGARVVILCQAEDGHGMRNFIASALADMLVSLRRWVRVDLDTENATYLRWKANDATLQIMEAGAGMKSARKRGRGLAINRLHCTESAAWDYAEETMTVFLNAMPQDAGEVVIESTPRGASGDYYDRYQKAVQGQGQYKAHFFPWYKHTAYRTPLALGERIVPQTSAEEKLVREGVSPEALKWHRTMVATQSAQKIAQEYPSDAISCFLVSGRSFFDAGIVQQMLDGAHPPVRTNRNLGGDGWRHQEAGDDQVPPVRVWELPVPGEAYVIGADPSLGTGGSAGAAIVIHRATGKHVATLWGQFRPWVMAKHLAALARAYNGAEIAVERNEGGGGGTCLRALDVDEKYANVALDRDGKPGLVTSASSRAQMLDVLEEAVRRRAFKTHDVHLLGEMRTFVVKVTATSERPEHEHGARDDLVMATAIAWECACRPRPRRSAGLGVVL
jgi:hypothetical protein